MNENIKKIINCEEDYQNKTINLIASENYPSLAVRKALGSTLTVKYAEGYPGKRYYSGCKNYDDIENLAIKLVKNLFKAEHVNVQPHSGTQANLAVYNAVLDEDDKFLAPALDSGGHLSHGAKVNFSGKCYNVKSYPVDKNTGWLDYDVVEEIAWEFRPKLIICGFTAYPRIIDFKKFAHIAQKVNAYVLADIAHIAGLIVAGLHPSPIEYADFITSTTHKTLRGPRGGFILTSKKYARIIDRAVFPGIQGGPAMNVIAAKAQCFTEASTSEFKKYQKQVVLNAKTLADELIGEGFNILTGGTDNHLLILDLRAKNISGRTLEENLEKVGILVNRELVPYDPRPPLETSGLRLGTPAITTRGAKEKDMIEIAHIIAEVINKPDSKIIKSSKEKVNKIVKKLKKI